MTSKSTTRKKEQSPRSSPRSAARSTKKLPAVVVLEGELIEAKRWEPHAYQKKAVKFLLEHAAAALFLDPGLGKTAVTLAAVKLLKKRGVLSKVLLIAPLRVCHSVWPKEVKKWEDFHGLRVEVLHGPKKDEALEREADVYLVNPEGLEWLLKAEKFKDNRGKTQVKIDVRRFKALGFDTLVVDELSKFKHTSSVRFKALKHVLGTFARRWGLTGSPAANGLMDLFGQAYVLDEGRSLGRFITHYRNSFFDKGYDGFSWTVKPDGEDRIYERLAPLVLRMDADDYLELPQIRENPILVDLPESVLPLYLALEEDLFAAIGDRTVTAPTAGAASGKCRQVASGAVYVDREVEATGFKLPRSKREWTELHTEKLDALESLVEELQGQPLLLAYEFNHDIERIKGRLGDIPVIGRGTKASDTGRIIKEWNDGRIPVLAVHPQSGAHGLDGLQEVGNHVCFFTLTWDFELYDQLIRRLRRQGNRSKWVTVHQLLARGTVEEDVRGALYGKDRGQQALFKALQARAKRRKR